MYKVRVDNARWVYSKDGGESRIAAIRLVNREGVYFVADQVDFVPIAKAHEGFQCVPWITPS
jgi:hypothetical protein